MSRSRRPLHHVNRAIWSDERGMSLFLALLVGWVFVVPIVHLRDESGSLFDDLFLTALLMTGAMSVPMRRWVRVAVIGIAVVALALRLDAGLWSPWIANELRWASFGVSCALLAVIVLMRVFSGGAITPHRILGAIAGYLLVGITWATLYGIVGMVRPDSFSKAIDGQGRDWIYFSFTTLTTVGYGDIVPVHTVARRLATLEALIGQLYPAVLIARLVSLEVSARYRAR